MMSNVQFEAVHLADPTALIFRMLPVQGSIEIQHDAAGKLHDWHAHDTDETLIILHGSVRFFSEVGERLCRPGDVIKLPCGVRHGSEALGEGAIYLIALRLLEMPAKENPPVMGERP